MAGDVKLVVGGSIEEDLASFVDAWKQFEAGQPVAPERVLAFDSWETLASVMTGERTGCYDICTPTRCRR